MVLGGVSQQQLGKMTHDFFVDRFEVVRGILFGRRRRRRGPVADDARFVEAEFDVGAGEVQLAGVVELREDVDEQADDVEGDVVQ